MKIIKTTRLVPTGIKPINWKKRNPPKGGELIWVWTHLIFDVIYQVYYEDGKWWDVKSTANPDNYAFLDDEWDAEVLCWCFEHELKRSKE